MVHDFSDFYGLFGFFIVPSNNKLGLFINLMKGRSALIFCIMYFAPPIRHLWWHPGCFHLHQKHLIHQHHHNHNHWSNHLFFIWLFLKTLIIIRKYVTSITNIQSVWLNHYFRKFIAPAPSKHTIAQKIQSCWLFKTCCIKRPWLIFIWCGITCHI